ncbi:MAG: hypothetical protein PHE56_15515, partial [Bacteroidales bacterium]|nr:hypothetical protein [Bacteroidales bacterium]
SLFAGIVIIMAMFMTVACEKEENSVADQQQSVRKPQPISDMEVMQYLPEVVDGRLVFKDEDAYLNYVQWVFENQSSPDKMNKINDELGFVCMNDIYREGMNLLESDTDAGYEYIRNHPTVFYDVEIDESIIHDMQTNRVLGYIFNELGIVQFGNKIDRVSYDYYYSITDGDASKIPTIVAANGMEIHDKDIITTKVRDESKSEWQYNYKTVYFSDSSKRVVARLIYGEAGSWKQYTAKTNTQKKVLGVWVGAKLSNDGAKVTATGYWNTINPIYESDTQNQDAEVMFYNELESPNLSLSSCTTVHSGKYNNVWKSYTHNNAFNAYY